MVKVGWCSFKKKAQYIKAWSFKDHGKNYAAVHKKDNSVGFKWLIESFGSNYRMTEIQSAWQTSLKNLIDGLK